MRHACDETVYAYTICTHSQIAPPSEESATMPITAQRPSPPPPY